MTQRETIVQVVKVEQDTTLIEEYERLRLLGNPPPARRVSLPVAPIVVRSRQNGLALTAFGLGLAAVAVAVLGAALMLTERVAP